MDDKPDSIEDDLVKEFRAILIRPLTKAEMRAIEVRVMGGCAIDPTGFTDVGYGR